MAGFLGSHLHQFDAKGRISLPAPFRRGRESDPFVLIRAQPEALSLYPEESWADVERDLREMARRRPEHRPLILALTAEAREVVPDGQGRILVPERMREAVGLDSEALIVGAIDRMELWEPGRFHESASRKSEEFDRFVSSIFA